MISNINGSVNEDLPQERPLSKWLEFKAGFLINLGYFLGFGFDQISKGFWLDDFHLVAVF